MFFAHIGNIFFATWDRNSFYPMDMERKLAKTFKTANIPTPGEVTWYAHHNPVMRWYEGCIYSFAESLG